MSILRPSSAGSHTNPNPPYNDNSNNSRNELSNKNTEDDIYTDTDSTATLYEGFINNDNPLSTTSPSRNEIQIQQIDWTKVQKLNVFNFEGILQTPILSRCKGTVTAAEFSGIMSIKNLHLVLQFCNNLHRLMLSNISLLQFQFQVQSSDFHRYAKLKVIRLTELVLKGPKKLTKDELEVLNFFNERVKFTALNTLRFLQKEKSSGSGSAHPLPLTSDHKRSRSRSRSRSGSVGFGSDSSNNSNNLSILDQFMNMYAGKIKTMEVNRVQLAFKEGKALPKLSLIKFVGDLSNIHFGRILLAQRNLKVLNVYNDEFVPIKIYENVAVSILSCENTLQDIRINNKYILFQDFDSDPDATVPFEDGYGNDNKRKLRTHRNPADTAYANTTIEHNLLVYKNCRHLRKLNVEISKVDYPYQNRIRGGEFSHFEGLPTGLESLILRFDLIEQKYLDGIGKRFSLMTKLKHFIFHGNPESLYIVETFWIENLVRLPLMEIFEFHFCIIDVPAVNALAKSVLGLTSKLDVTQYSCTYWKTREI